MRWSQLKKRLESRFSESLKGRVELWETRYRRVHDQEGEFWVTVDAIKVYSLSTGALLELQGKLVYEYKSTNVGSTWADAYSHAEPLVEASGQMLLEDVNSALFQSLSMSVEDCLQHTVALIRGLGMLDRRLGKRRLQLLLNRDQPPFVRLMNNLRCATEGIRVEPSNPPLNTDARQETPRAG